MLNGKNSIEDCIKSVRSQPYNNIEHIIIDGGSMDGTLDVIAKYRDKIAHVVSEPDNGIYDALNKGIGMATGNIVGMLHADDLYANSNVINTVVQSFNNNNVDCCYGDLLYVKRNNVNTTIRYWKSSNYSFGKFKYGWMPPHPTFFVKRVIYDRYGCFNTDFRIAADYELLLRFFVKHRITSHYIPDVLTKMRLGGVSNRNLKNLIIKSVEDYKSWKINKLNGGLFALLLKNISKLPQFLRRCG